MLCIVCKKIAAALLFLTCGLAQAAPFECPINAPAEWKVPKARLDRARVFSGSSEGLPEREWQMGGTLIQTWKLKAGTRTTAYQVDCLYAGTPRFLRFDARKVARCIARRRVRADTLMPGSMEFRCR
jgi:hypothetical protein